MDLEMPVMDGYEATDRIRQAEQKNNYRKTYICALSASTDVGKKYLSLKQLLDTIDRCKKCGMDDYLSKPLNMEIMLRLISEQFNNASKKK